MTVDLRLLSPGAVTPKLTGKLRRLATDLDRIAVAAAANSSIAHGQDDRAKDGCVGADGWNNGSIERHRVGRRRLAFSAMTGGRS